MWNARVKKRHLEATELTTAAMIIHLTLNLVTWKTCH